MATYHGYSSRQAYRVHEWLYGLQKPFERAKYLIKRYGKIKAAHMLADECKLTPDGVMITSVRLLQSFEDMPSD